MAPHVPSWAPDPRLPSSLSLRILLTGPSGFLGKNLLPALQLKYPRSTITAADLPSASVPTSSSAPYCLSTPNSSPLDEIPKRASTPHAQVRHVDLDITDPAAVAHVVREADPDLIFHLAAVVVNEEQLFHPTAHERALIYGVNVGGTENVLKALDGLAGKGAEQIPGAKAREGMGSEGRRRRRRALVFSGSVAAVMLRPGRDYVQIDETQVPEGSTDYGISKAESEALVLRANDTDALLTTVLRISPIVGIGDTLTIPSIHRLINQGLSVFQMSHGRNTWNFTAIQDVVDGMLLAADNLLATIHEPDLFKHTRTSSPVTPDSGDFEIVEKAMVDTAAPDAEVPSSPAKRPRTSAAGQVFFLNDPDPVPWRALNLYIWHLAGHNPPYTIVLPVFVLWLFGLLTEIALALGWTQNRSLSRVSAPECTRTRDSRPDKAMEVLGWYPRVGVVKGVQEDVASYVKLLESRKSDSRPKGP